MKILGLDFTSAPTKKKPLTLARCRFQDATLTLETFETLASFHEFEALLEEPGPWVAGLDFPFGQPARLIQNLDWPKDWEAYVDLVASMGKDAFVSTLLGYSQSRPYGDKLHFRLTDRLAGAQSPMKLHFVPIGRMFFQGAPRLRESSVSILPNRPTDDTRIVLEAYPAWVAKTFAERSGYKSDNKDKQTSARRAMRQRILGGLYERCRAYYGFSVEVADDLLASFVDDPTGDRMDALLAAIPAAWAYTQRHQNFGIPQAIDPLEGWIVDPQLLAMYEQKE